MMTSSARDIYLPLARVLVAFRMDFLWAAGCRHFRCLRSQAMGSGNLPSRKYYFGADLPQIEHLKLFSGMTIPSRSAPAHR